MTDWFWEKVDTFLAAVVVAVAGILACQGHAFMAQYVDHLGANVTTARLHLADVQSGLRYRVMGETVRAELEVAAQADYKKLKKGQDAIVGANVVTRPLMFAHYSDGAIAAETKRNFEPKLPSSAGSIAYVLAGMLIGFVLYELVKLPVMLIVREPRRKFRRRG